MLLFEVMSPDKSHGNGGMARDPGAHVDVPAAAARSMRTHRLYDVVPSIRISQNRGHECLCMEYEHELRLWDTNVSNMRVHAPTCVAHARLLRFSP